MSVRRRELERLLTNGALGLIMLAHLSCTHYHQDITAADPTSQPLSLPLLVAEVQQAATARGYRCDPIDEALPTLLLQCHLGRSEVSVFNSPPRPPTVVVTDFGAWNASSESIALRNAILSILAKVSAPNAFTVRERRKYLPFAP